MKKLMILAAAVAATVACTKNSIIYEEPDTPIQMNPTAQISTKTQAGPVSGTAYSQKESFGVFAFYDQTIKPGDSWGTDYNTIYINGVEFKYITDAWTSENAYYWPKQGSLVFAGYSPFKAAAEGNAEIPGGWDATNKGIKFTDYVNPIYNGTSSKQNDLMWFDVESTSAASNSPYAAGFKHALSQLVFTVKAADVTAQDLLTIKKIELLNVKKQGSFASKPTAGWTNKTTTETYTIYDSGAGAKAAGTAITTGGATYPTDSGVLVLPQDQTAVKVYYAMKYNNGKDGVQYLDFDFTYTPTLKSTWDLGKKYTYTIKLTATGQITINATINEWVNGDGVAIGNN